MLPPDERDEYRTCVYYKNNHGRETSGWRTIFRKVIKLPPIDNPRIEALRRLLKRQRVQWTENVSGDYLEFSTIDC